MSTRPRRVLVVDDEPAMREVLEARLSRWGYEVRVAADVATVRAQLLDFVPDLVVSDLVMPDGTGLDVVEMTRAVAHPPAVVLITAYGTIDTAVAGLKAGAADYLTKPIDYPAFERRLIALGGPTVVASRADEKTPTFGTAPAVATPAGTLVGCGPAMATLRERVRVAADSDAPVLLVGESGSGKELVARAIHAASERRHGAFVPVNAAAIPESLAEAEFFGHERGAFTGAERARAGLFEAAHGGTLFLDEITEMSGTLQPKLLRVLEDSRVRRVGGEQEREVNARVVAATNRDPLRAVEEGSFRRDLLYRVDVLRIAVPPLRERLEDVAELADHFLGTFARRYDQAPLTVEPDAWAPLRGHDWPGNVRELRNVIERVFWGAADGVVRAAQVGEVVDGGSRGEASELTAKTSGIVIPAETTAADAERILILETLKRTDNNKAETARRLGLDVKTVRNKLKAFEARGDS